MLSVSPATTTPPQLLVDAREAARLMSIGERTLWSLTNRGVIGCVRIGRSVRYSVSALDAFIAKQTTQA